MLKKITSEVLSQISNPVFKDNARIYLDIESDFLSTIKTFGLPVANENSVSDEPLYTTTDPRIKALTDQGLAISNDNKSFCRGWKSPSCIACQTGIGSATFLISTQCPRNCFFCFNPNQEDYLRLQHEMDDPTAQLADMHEHGMLVSDIALTGGEPLVHKKETIEFFHMARALYPQAYTRLYTSGTHLDADCLAALADAGLDEIRFSLKTDDSPKALEKTYNRIQLATKYIEQVMVEMPVMPDELEFMKNLLLTLDELGVDGINLLELCFPFNNAEEFNKRGYVLKNDPFRVLYNYWYAGGLPIAGSESVCLNLLVFAAEQKLSMGVHYCSLENKFTGQIYQQNSAAQLDYPYCSFSEKDYFLKSIKIYGPKAKELSKLMNEQRGIQSRFDSEAAVLEFSPIWLESLKTDYPDLEVALSYHVVEPDSRGQRLRELRLDLTTPGEFNINEDL